MILLPDMSNCTKKAIKNYLSEAEPFLYYIKQVEENMHINRNCTVVRNY